MKQKLLVRYISIIVMLASFMGSMHHHSDVKQHSDCQICTIQHNVTDIDTPVDISYLTLFFLDSVATIVTLTNLQTQTLNLSVSARSPPLFS